MKRTAALTLQMCILNGLSMIAAAIVALLVLLQYVFMASASCTALDVTLNIYNNYFYLSQYAVVICSSNIGFLVHCYYSSLYRKAAWETFAAINASCKKYLKVCGCNGTANKVHPNVRKYQILKVYEFCFIVT